MDPAYFVQGVTGYGVSGIAELQASIEYRFLMLNSPWIRFILTGFTLMGTTFMDGALSMGGDTRSPDGASSPGVGLRIVAYGLASMIGMDFGASASGPMSGMPPEDA